jgi:septal ring factor EnvC (AmiA/AmiB activator)
LKLSPTYVNFLCAIGLIAGSAGMALAGDERPPVQAQQELGIIAEQIERSRKDKAALERQLSAMQQESAVLSDRLVALAADIQGRETLIAKNERRLERLHHEELVMRGKLIGQREALGNLLAGLQRLERNPPPPLVTRPDDTVATLRGAMLFGTIVPKLKVQASRLARDLARLEEVQARIGHEKSELESNLSSLQNARYDMKSLLARKQELISATSGKLDETRKRLAVLASKAKSLSQLVAALKREKTRQAELDAERAREEKQQLEAEKKRLTALRATPPMVFSKARGELAYPVLGTRIRGFGDPDGFGGESKGLSISTRKAAQIISPADGKVEFAGNFRSYGELLILDVGEGYHILLAGLGEISVQPGQLVRAGEPVGEMGKVPARGTLIGDQLEAAKPILYVEFRRNGGSIDPSGWWAGNRKEVRR